MRPPELPCLGLGAGLSPDQLPDVLALAGGTLPADYVELLSDEPARLGEAMALLPEGTPAVLHGNALSPAGADGIPAQLVCETRRVADRLGAAWVLEDLATWRLDGERPVGAPFWPPVFDEELVELVASRLPALEACLGRPFLCEVAPLDVYAGELDLSDFFAALTRSARCGLVLDVSHWLRYAQLRDVEPEAHWNRFPMEQVIELHVSGGRRVAGPRWYEEEHSAALLPECLDLLAAALAACPQARAVTVESHGAPPEVVLASLAAAVAVPAVGDLRRRGAALRGRRSLASAIGPGAPATRDLEHLARPGSFRLRRRQRTMRRLLEQPRDRVAANRDGPGSPVEDEDRRAFTVCPPTSWEEASRRRLARLGGLPPIATTVLRETWGDPGVAYARYAATCRDLPRGPVEPLALLDLLVEAEDLPPWARDTLAFERDVLRVADGLRPASPFVDRDDGGVLVSYRRPVIATVRAVSTGASRPPARRHLVEMSPAGGRLTVRDAGPAPEL
jgi:uncharacterized protein (UPF0276 family)